MYVNRPVAPAYYYPPAQPARPPVQAYPAASGLYQPYNASSAGSDPIANLKVLATNVWNTLMGFAKSFWAAAQNALSTH